MSKFYKIGGVVSFDGVNLLVKGQIGNKPSCMGCFFTDDNRKKHGLKRISCYLHGMSCTAAMRRDNKHVVFIPLK